MADEKDFTISNPPYGNPPRRRRLKSKNPSEQKVLPMEFAQPEPDPIETFGNTTLKRGYRAEIRANKILRLAITLLFGAVVILTGILAIEVINDPSKKKEIIKLITAVISSILIGFLNFVSPQFSSGEGGENAG